MEYGEQVNRIQGTGNAFFYYKLLHTLKWNGY